MKDGICPKCGSDEIYTRASFANYFFNDLKNVQGYICADCGYMEMYTPAKNDRVSVLWNRVKSPIEKPKTDEQA